MLLPKNSPAVFAHFVVNRPVIFDGLGPLDPYPEYFPIFVGVGSSQRFGFVRICKFRWPRNTTKVNLFFFLVFFSLFFGIISICVFLFCCFLSFSWYFLKPLRLVLYFWVGRPQNSYILSLYVPFLLFFFYHLYNKKLGYCTLC